MKDLALYRYSGQADDTLGLLFGDGEFVCFTLEDEYRDEKRAGETRIPGGTYQIKLQAAGRIHEKYAVRFHDIHVGTLMLQDVPLFSGVAIHCGTTQGDTDGCILVGNGVMQNVTGNGSLIDSTGAYRRLYSAVAPRLKAGERVFLDVKELV